MFSNLSRNSFWLLLARFGTQLGTAFFTILLARRLGSIAFGEYAFIAAVAVIGNVVTTFGTDMLLIRRIASTDQLSQLPAALFIQLALSAVFVTVIAEISPMLQTLDTQAIGALRLYSLSMFPLAFYTIFTTALRGRQRMGSYAILNVSLIVLQIIAVAWFSWMGRSLIDLFGLLLLIQGIAAVLAAIFCSLQFADVWQSWRFTMHEAWSLARTSAPIAMLGLLGIFYQRVSVLILPMLAGAAITGWFSAGARLIEAAKIGHIAVFTALYPLMAQVGPSNKPNWASTFRLPWLLLLGGALLASFALYLLAAPLVALLFGLAYLPSISVVQILAWVLVPYTVNAFLSLAFLAREDESSIAVALTAGILALVILTIWWEPLIGPRGAAWAAVCAELTQSAILVARDFRTGQLLQSMLKTGPAL